MRFQFPIWTNRFVGLMAVVGVTGLAYVSSIVFAATAPSTLNIGYEPKQPIPFSHKVHAGQLKMDCRYCHNTVDKAAHAALPATSTCMNCHSGSDSSGNVEYAAIHAASPKLEPLRRSHATGDSVAWTKVHDLPDYVYFDHSIHVNSGVSCVSCHGRVDRMDVVKQTKTLSMTFCLDCHRNPDPHLRPLDKVTDLGWEPENDFAEIGSQVRKKLNINPNTNCSTCHR